MAREPKPQDDKAPRDDHRDRRRDSPPRIDARVPPMDYLDKPTLRPTQLPSRNDTCHHFYCLTTGVQSTHYSWIGACHIPATKGSSRCRLQRSWLAGLAFMGLWMAAGTLAIFAWELSTGTPLAHAQTEAFTVSATFQAFSAFCFRSADRPIYQLPPNWWLFGGALLAFGIQCLAVYLPPLQSFLGTVPLQPWEFALSVGAGFTLLILAEIYKVLQQQLRRNQ